MKTINKVLLGGILALSLAILVVLAVRLDEPAEDTAPAPVEVKTVEQAVQLRAIQAPAPVVAVEPEPVSLGEFKITHYCACPKCCGKDESDPWYGITSTGTRATEGRTIAVDPKVIPYGSEVLLRYADGTEHTYIAEDCGGAIKSKRIDVYMDSHRAALVEGVKYAEVYLVKE